MNFRLFVLASLLVLTACDDNYGEKTQKFVRNEVPELSLKMARTAFERKVAQGHVLEYSRQMLMARNIFEVVQKSSQAIDLDFGKMNMEKAQVQRSRLIKAELALLNAKSELLTIKDDLAELGKICKTMKGHELREIVKEDVFQFAVPKDVENYYVSTNFIETAARFVMDQFSSNKQSKQNAMMREALEELPLRIASEEKLLKVYIERCEVAQKKFLARAENQKFQIVFDAMIRLIDRNLALTQRTIAVFGSHIYQLAYRELSQKFGVDSILENERRTAFYSRISKTYSEHVARDFSLMRKMIQAKSRAEYLDLKRNWDTEFFERNLFLASVKEAWPFHAEKERETLQRKEFVESFSEMMLKERLL